MSYRFQVNLTVNKEQQQYIRDNFEKMTWKAISDSLQIPYSKVIRNANIMGLYKNNAPYDSSRRNDVISDKNGYFDVDKFAKLYL